MDGHSNRDKSLSVLIDDNAPEGYLVTAHAGEPFDQARDYVRDKLGLDPWKPDKPHKTEPVKIIAQHIYRQPDGTPYLRVTRQSDKQFPQAHWDGERWLPRKPAGPKIPYRLPELLAAHPDEPVWIVEGEKSADYCAGLGMVATTASEGAGKWLPELNEWFQGRTVYVVPDNDDVGRKYAQTVADVLGATIVRLPYTTPKHGADDWLAQGNTVDALLAFALNSSEIAPEEETSDFQSITAEPFNGEMPGPRPWAFGTILLHRTVTAIAAPPGTGKTTWAIQLGIAFSQHREFGGMKPRRTGPVWIWNNEDDGDELNRRTIAACMNMGVNMSDLAGQLYLNSGADRQLIVAVEGRDGGGVVATPDVEGVIAVIKERGIKLLIVDPFAETYKVRSENDNDAMKAVAALYRIIAQRADCAVLLITHTPKGTNSDRNAGSIDAIRGGGSIAGVVRSLWTMFEMSETDAETCGVSDERRHLYIRLDDAKSNMSLKSGKPSWWMRQSEALDNGTDDDPEDVVGVLVPVEFVQPEPVKKDYGPQVWLIADEIVRVATVRSALSVDRGVAIDTMCDALNVDRIGLKKSMIKTLVFGNMGAVYTHENHRIVITETDRGGGQVIRRMHIEGLDQ